MEQLKEKQPSFGNRFEITLPSEVINIVDLSKRQEERTGTTPR